MFYRKSSSSNSAMATPDMVSTPSSLSTINTPLSSASSSMMDIDDATANAAAASPLTPTIDQDGIVHTLRAMRSKESQYKTTDYLAAASSNSPEWVDEDCRSKMCEWCLQIVDHCGDDFSRDTVAIAMNILDRYLAVPSSIDAIRCRSTFQLTCVTAFYTAVKVHEPCAISASTLSILSKNLYTVEQLESTERKMLQTIGWRVHPRTPRMFGHYMLDLVGLADRNLRDTVEQAMFMQMDHAMQEYSFIGTDASMIAMASLLNALAGCVSAEELFQMEQLLSYATQLPCQSAATTELQRRLYVVLVQQQQQQQQQDATMSNAHVYNEQQQQQQQQVNTKTTASSWSGSRSVEHSPTSTVRI